MCDRNRLDFGIKNLGDADIKGKRVLEVGSCDVNGSLRAGVIEHGPSEYIGIDIAFGPGVDAVCSSDDILKKFGEESFDVVLSTCALEHIANWKLAISNMKRACRHGGIILLIVPSEWPWHNYPYDFWRYSHEDIKVIFSDFEILVIEEAQSFHGPARIGNLVYVKMRKPAIDTYAERDISSYKLFNITTKGWE